MVTTRSDESGVSSHFKRYWQADFKDFVPVNLRGFFVTVTDHSLAVTVSRSTPLLDTLVALIKSIRVSAAKSSILAGS